MLSNRFPNQYPGLPSVGKANAWCQRVQIVLVIIFCEYLQQLQEWQQNQKSWKQVKLEQPRWSQECCNIYSSNAAVFSIHWFSFCFWLVWTGVHTACMATGLFTFFRLHCQFSVNTKWKSLQFHSLIKGNCWHFLCFFSPHFSEQSCTEVKTVDYIALYMFHFTTFLQRPQ